MSDKHEKPKLERFGLIATATYLALLFVGIPILIYLGHFTLKPLSLNELGDFLAGAFGPLAIFWVVLGFFQQGAELRNSVDTLKMQAEELRLSVEQQKELVGVTRETLKHEKLLSAKQEQQYKASIQPNFLVTLAGGSANGSKVTNNFWITNTGNDVSDVNIQLIPKPFQVSLKSKRYWTKGEEVNLQIQFLEEWGAPISGVLQILFTDVDNNTDGHSFQYQITDLENPFIKEKMTRL